MKKQRLDKAKVVVTVTTVVLIMLIPTMNRIANTMRSEPAWGGECIAWMIPPLLYMLYRTMKEGFGE